MRELGPGPRRVLDAACGIGTQAIGLALNGHAVTGSDFSPAVRFGAEIEFRVADFRHLSHTARGSFDVVCALDSALAHTDSAKVLAAVMSQMSGCLVPDESGYDQPLAVARQPT